MTDDRRTIVAGSRLPERIDATRLDLAAEFWDRPFGRHSADLQALLAYMRGGPIAGKYFLWMLEPHAKWQLARFGAAPHFSPARLDPVFTDILEAERYVFAARWKTIFGVELELP